MNITAEKIDLDTKQRIQLLGQLNDRADLLTKQPDKAKIKALITDLECIGLHQRAREMRELIGE